MKFKLSLNAYLLGTISLLGLITIISFSSIAFKYFFEGMDLILKTAMLEATRGVSNKQISPLERFGFIITTDFSTLPNEHQKYFTAYATPMKLHKKIIKNNFFSRPKHGYFLLRVNIDEFSSFYVVTKLGNKKIPVFVDSINPVAWLLGFIAIIVTFFFIVIYLIKQSIFNPAKKLQQWAENLHKDNIKNSHPNFIYSELNQLANLIQKSLLKSQENIEREKEFLRFSSHELRTPIAIIGSNLELLKKLNEPISEKQAVILDRINRAGLTMKHLTETLLWLSREDGMHEKGLAPMFKEVRLDEQIKSIVSESEYLLKHKNITLNITTNSFKISLPYAAVHIVLTNIIRNAYQHTQEGVIDIIQQDSKVIVANYCNEPDGFSSSDLGFGLGLQLTKKLLKKYNWKEQFKTTDNQFYCSVDFS